MEDDEIENENKEEENLIIYPPILNRFEKIIFPLFTRFVKRIPFNNFLLVLIKILEDAQWLLFSLREDWFEGSSYIYNDILNNINYNSRIYFKNHLYNKKIILSSINLIIHVIFGYMFSKYFINPFIISKSIIISRTSNSIMEKQFIIKLIMLIDMDILSFLNITESMIISILLLLYILHSYLKYYPYYNQNMNYYSISFIVCTLYQIIITLIFNIMNLNNSTVWKIFMFSSIPVLPIAWFLAKYKYTKLIDYVYKNIRKKKILQKKGLNEKYIKKFSEEQLIDSMDDILNSSMPKIKKNMFKKEHHCELACRYILFNRDPEAYQLMKYIFSEGILQYSDCTQLYIEFWFFFFSLRTFLKNNNRKLNLYMDEKEIKNMNQLIELAKSKKPCSRDTLLITIAINLIDKEDKKIANDTNNDQLKEITNTSIEYRQLKSQAVELHMKALSEIKVLLKSLRASSNKKDTYFYIDCIKNLSKFQVKCDKKYYQLITKYDKTKTILHLYVVFIVHIMNQPEQAVCPIILIVLIIIYI
ncbi:hypothetical protein H8356DRAFT_939562 [Neocallimastix lanati (nom. inval.)]|nr:hypothetical protein H8356DRAFT_939562 [Neocallimastix sp. JGI-2020a]